MPEQSALETEATLEEVIYVETTSPYEKIILELKIYSNTTLKSLDYYEAFFQPLVRNDGRKAIPFQREPRIYSSNRIKATLDKKAKQIKLSFNMDEPLQGKGIGTFCITNLVNRFNSNCSDYTVEPIEFVKESLIDQKAITNRMEFFKKMGFNLTGDSDISCSIPSVSHLRQSWNNQKILAVSIDELLLEYETISNKTKDIDESNSKTINQLQAYNKERLYMKSLTNGLTIVCCGLLLVIVFLMLGK
jgi:hypothetical protein